MEKKQKCTSYTIENFFKFNFTNSQKKRAQIALSFLYNAK